MDDWTEALDNKHQIEVIYMDIRKAFDTVPHKRLMLKINHLGINDKLLFWIKDFLDQRLQHVKIMDNISSSKQVISGIPQGTVLGPILFIMYINDLPDNITSHLFMFADDTKIYKKSNEHYDLQDDLNQLQKWSDDWLLRFHPAKCIQLNISRGAHHIETSQRKLKDPDNPSLDINLKTCEDHKDLGVIFDSKLDFNIHINKKISKASQMMGMIRRGFRNLTPQIFKPLYTSLVRSHLEYAQTVWNPHHVTEIKRLESVQRNATKQINGFKSLSYTERLKILGLPTLRFRRLRGEMIETYKILHKIYKEDSVPNLPRNKQEIRGHNFKLYKQRANTDIRKYSFTFRVVNNWNALPNFIAEAPTIKTFKQRLDKHWNNHPMKYDPLLN